jgi:hypothetical protein
LNIENNDDATRATNKKVSEHMWFSRQKKIDFRKKCPKMQFLGFSGFSSSALTWKNMYLTKNDAFSREFICLVPCGYFISCVPLATAGDKKNGPKSPQNR